MVPEWRTRYVEYKQGKKRIKATTNKLRNAAPSPALASLRRNVSRVQGAEEPKSPINRPRGLSLLRGPSVPSRSSIVENTDENNPPNVGPAPPPRERTPLQPTAPVQLPHTTSQGPVAIRRPSVASARRPSVNYGSSGFSPGFPPGTTLPQVMDENQIVRTHNKPPSLKLPEPIQPFGMRSGLEDEGPTLQPSSMGAMATPPMLTVPSRPATGRSASVSAVSANAPQMPFLQRVFSMRRASVVSQAQGGPTVDEVQAEAEKEFLKWLLKELKKCDNFYVAREVEARARFNEMREQLDIMRERWFREKHNILFEEDDVEDVDEHEESAAPDIYDNGSVDSAGRKTGAAWKSFSEAMNGLTKPHPSTPQISAAQVKTEINTGYLIPEGSKDYQRRAPTRRPLNNPVHRVAKRKLKRAYIEYYHGLEMLKSYVTVNRECFRKITKKFDKASGLRTSHRFMTEYVDKSKFGSADNDLDDMLSETEILFARFFERGNRKEASARLRSKEHKTLYYSSVGKTGFFLGCSVVLGVFGLYNSIVESLDQSNPERALRMSYLLQIWGGFALILLQVLLFAVNLRIWAHNKINYAFIFEFDTRHQMNYRQFLEFPSLIVLVFAICFWFSSHDFWDGRMDMIYWPVIFCGIAIMLVFNPFRICYYYSRRWFLRVLWRLLCSGLYPVEFKDFFIGDMLCSQSYALGNISLFFCLYKNHWNDPVQCNSNHSRLMGFFTALPATWRFLQCIRRYRDSRMWFPHLANGGKYLFTILHYMTLSMWRIQNWNVSYKATFIAMASCNTVYCTLWDICMDWSLMDPSAKHPFLRKNIGFKHTWPYYLAMFVDPIIRADWFFYIVYASQLQHSALLSFVLALAEVLRRFMWCFFRMENEHIGNVGANRAYRDLPLPYHLPQKSPTPSELEAAEPLAIPHGQTVAEHDLERMGTMRRRISRPSTTESPVLLVRTITRVGRSIGGAHMYDYERRRGRDEEVELSGESDDDDEDGEDFFERTREMGPPER